MQMLEQPRKQNIYRIMILVSFYFLIRILNFSEVKKL